MLNRRRANKTWPRPRRTKQGAAYHDAGAYEQAIAEYQAAYELAALPELVFNIAQVYRLKQDKRAALDTYRRFLTLETEGKLADEARVQVAILTKELGETIARVPETKPAVDGPLASAASEQPKRARGRGLQIAGLTTGVVGLVSIGVAVKFGLDARSASDDADRIARDAEQNNSWDGGAAARFDTAVSDGETAERRMYIGYGVGGALVATGAVLFVLGVRADREHIQVGPAVTQHSAGLRVQGAF
jgi:tetratricopeptide (TPR) repeat protein